MAFFGYWPKNSISIKFFLVVNRLHLRGGYTRSLVPHALFRIERRDHEPADSLQHQLRVEVWRWTDIADTLNMNNSKINDWLTFIATCDPKRKNRSESGDVWLY